MLKNTVKLVHLAFGVLIVLPVAWLLPKKKNLVLFIGNGDGQFRDNVKYLYLHLLRTAPTDIEFYFLTENRSTHRQLQQSKLPVLLFPLPATLWKMLRASVVVADNFAWIKRTKYHFLTRAFKVQLWHGCSIKRLELDDPLLKPAPTSMVGRVLYTAAGRFPTYDLFLSTSEANTENIFKHAFRYRQIIESGYPRNDVFFRKPDPYDLMGADTAIIEQVNDLKERGYRVVLYAPTYRDTGNGDDFLQNAALDMAALNRFATERRIAFVIKVHPNRRFEADFHSMPLLLLYNTTADVYPFLFQVDLLLTDYSSIFFDFLHFDRPIVFFPYDYEKYIRQDRKLKYDYNWITPGPKCGSQQEVERAIASGLSHLEEDPFRQKRKEIRDMAFSRQAVDSARHIMEEIRQTCGL